VCHATDDDRQATEAAEFRKKLDAMVIAADMKKRYNTARAWVLAATALLEEEEHVAAVLTVEAHAMATLIKTPSPTLPPPPAPVALLHRTMTMRPPLSPMSMSRPSACRTSVLSSQSRWTSPPHTTLGGATMYCSPSGITLSL
jgi:hypothetical protein